MSKHLRGQRHDAHELLVAQLAAHWAEDASTARGLVVLDENGGIFVEADVAAIGTALLFLHPHDDALHHVALLHGGAGDGVFHGGHEDVTDRSVTTARVAQHLDAKHFFGSGVVSDPKSRFLLDHYLALSSTSTNRHRLSFDSGRVSMTLTRSPIWASLVSSWA